MVVYQDALDHAKELDTDERVPIRQGKT